MDSSAIESGDVTFDFRELSARDKYKLIVGTVVPRPIALVTTVDPEGRINAAPFSFFNFLSTDPPILALGVENHPDMRFKDTGLNIRLTEVFTVNIVSHAIAEAMHVCAVPFGPDHDELKAASLTAMPPYHAGTRQVAPDHHGRDFIRALPFRRRRHPLQLKCNLLISLELKTADFTDKTLISHAESQTLNQRAPGSSPGAATKSFNSLGGSLQGHSDRRSPAILTNHLLSFAFRTVSPCER